MSRRAFFIVKNAYQTKHTLPPTIPPQTTCLPHGADIFQEKGLDVGQELHCRDWVGVLGTETFLNSNLVTPENFVQFYPFVQKLFMIFFNLDGRTDAQTPYKTNHPSTLYRCGWKFFVPFFLPLTKRSELHLHFVWIIMVYG